MVNPKIKAKEKEKKKMAKNWTLKEAVAVIAAGTDKEAICELAKRFPLTSMAIAKMGTNVGIEALFGGMPEHMTMLKMERSLKDGVSEAVEDEDEEDAADTEEAAAVSEAEEDFNAMTTKQLYELCIKRGLKVSKYGKPKSYYVEQLTAAAGNADEEEEEPEKGEDPGYEDMSAVELFKLCKKRGLKVEPKKSAKAYIALLKKADEEADAAEEDEDDWGDEEEEEKPAKKSAKAAAKKEEKKAAKKPVDEDEDDDWDI